MSIATYDGLKETVAGFLMRDDLTAIIPTFITLAEASFNRKLRDWRMETRSTAAFDENYEILPSNWLETIRLELDGVGPLQLVSPLKMMQLRSDLSATGNPAYFTHSAGQIEFYPVPTTSIGTGQLVYFGKIPSLSDSLPTNWLLSEAPDLYLYGALLHSAPYLKDDARIAVWGGLYADIINSMNNASEAARFSGPLIMGIPNG